MFLYCVSNLRGGGVAAVCVLLPVAESRTHLKKQLKKQRPEIRKKRLLESRCKPDHVGLVRLLQHSDYQQVQRSDELLAIFYVFHSAIQHQCYQTMH